MRYVCIGLAFFIAMAMLGNCRKANLGQTKEVKMEISSPNANEAQQDPLESPAEVSISGEYMKAFLAAYAEFQKDPDVPAKKKKIENYTVEFRQDSEAYIIFFFAKRAPSERLAPGGESSLGKDVSYTVKKSDYQIKAKSFYR